MPAHIDDTAIPGGTTADMYLECEVFDQAGTGNCIDGTAKAGILNTYLHRCRTRMAFSAPSMRLQKAERCRFDGAAFATYSRLQDSFFGGSIFVTSVPPPDVEPYGFVGCSFAAGITFTGPAASLVLDSNSNYWFKTRGCLLGGAASKVITGDLTP